ncbi:MAG: hypothetical protein KAY32_14890 [Candidatus Eisenbacteria sp.]|nr:hypothetical protein [Candidatus Eisenbacteria bacterium]
MILELVSKIVVTLILVWVLLGLRELVARAFTSRASKAWITWGPRTIGLVLLVPAVWAVWSGQIDVVESSHRFFTSRPLDDVSWLATRDPGLIYQDRLPVAAVVGEVEHKGERVVFARLTHAEQLDRNKPIEYRRERLRIMKFESYSMLHIGGSGAPGPTYVGVECAPVE